MARVSGSAFRNRSIVTPDGVLVLEIFWLCGHYKRDQAIVQGSDVGRELLRIGCCNGGSGNHGGTLLGQFANGGQIFTLTSLFGSSMEAILRILLNNCNQ